jgi:DNA-binding PadR family transcriptional regulator
MTEQRHLLIMGLLYQSDMHGYMLNAHLGMTMPISLKKPTAYNILESLEREGLVTGSQEATGDRKRRVFTLSELGRERYVEMLQKQLAEFIPGEYPGMVSMSFLDDLPPEEANRALAKRLEKIKSFTDELATHSQDRDCRAPRRRSSGTGIYEGCGRAGTQICSGITQTSGGTPMSTHKNPAIEVRNLVKSYDGKTNAVDDLSFSAT